MNAFCVPHYISDAILKRLSYFARTSYGRRFGPRRYILTSRDLCVTPLQCVMASSCTAASVEFRGTSSNEFQCTYWSHDSLASLLGPTALLV